MSLVCKFYEVKVANRLLSGSKKTLDEAAEGEEDGGKNAYMCKRREGTESGCGEADATQREHEGLFGASKEGELSKKEGAEGFCDEGCRHEDVGVEKREGRITVWKKEGG